MNYIQPAFAGNCLANPKIWAADFTAIYTIQVALKRFTFASEILPAPMMAGATISAPPMFVMFFSLQKYFMEGVTIGAVKG